MKKILFAIFFAPLLSMSQNSIGLPDVINYPKLVFGAGLQSWDMKQDRNGTMYFANNEGLLSFDGHYWSLYPLPNKTIVRSVEIGTDHRIYAGGQDEFGFFSPDGNGRLRFNSLTGLIPEKDRSFGDVWDIAAYKNDIFFRTSNKIYRFSNGVVAVYTSLSEWSYMGICQGRLYAHDYLHGLLKFDNNTWLPLQVPNLLSTNDPVTALLPAGGDSMIITTLKNGLYLLQKQGFTKITSSVTTQIEQNRIYAATVVNEKWIALATNNNGVYITDHEGQLIQRFSKQEGLQNNNVLSIFLDKQGNLWLGLDNGIDFIAYNSAIKRITPNGQDGSGYTSLIHNNHLYTGTSGGLFNVLLQQTEDLSFSKGDFQLVSNTTGQTWNMAEINGQLLLGHHEGPFLVNGNAATPIATNEGGFWNFTPMSAVFPTARVIAGNYKGLSFLDAAGNQFNLAERIPDFQESSRFVVLDRFDNIWVSHPYHGVYRITQSTAGNYHTKLYTAANGLPSTLNNQVYKVKNELLVATEKGVYIYNYSKDSFEPSPFYERLLGKQSLRYLKEDTEGNLWFIHEKSLGILDMSAKDTTIIHMPELTNKLVSGFEFIYPVDGKNIFVGGERGFFHINYNKYKKNIPALSVMIRSVKIANGGDSLLFGGFFSDVDNVQEQSKKQVPEISHNWGNVRFEFASPLFGQQGTLEYSYRLKNFDNSWSEWTPKREKEYTHLPAGSYNFEVKVRNNLGNESQPCIYKFTILPPWYQTIWAYIIYFVLLTSGLFYLYRWQSRKFVSQQIRHEEEQRKLQYLHQLEINKAENELVALRNEKLQVEIDFKNSELATSAMHLVQKGEILTRIKSDLNHIIRGLDNEKAVNELKKMIKVLSEDDKMDKDWEHFAQHFDKVHSDFVVALKDRFPTITANELKLCAYLRMNLSTKEIAQLMNISVRGVEIGRYRLRKKLAIPSETNLFDFLISISGKIN